MDYADKLNYTENDAMYFMTSLPHPSYVYAAQFFPDYSTEREERLIITTICYDQKVRVWLVTKGMEGEF